MAGTSPRARAIGAELRRAREDAGLSARTLAARIGVAHTTVGRWESGERSPRPTDVATVLGALGTDHELREELVELSRNTDGRHWVASGLPEQQRQLAALLELERDATRIVNVSPLLIPGLLQTSGYARAIIGAGGVPAGEIETRVAVRIGRRDVIMRRERPAELLALVDESALRRNIGGPAVMAEQLRALDEASCWSNVTLRAIPESAGWHPALEGPFDVLEFVDRTPVVQIENRRSALFFHESVDVEAYRLATDRVQDIAMSPDETRAFIADVLGNLETKA
ncbi:helix-turn-helix transcriptional regulator [Amycolatopsis sp. NPDC049253]|uniref:helix-turn-helix domain-containing protein n=1 Tax=Amycolatopsis sp. NPDC049253 TaxID=3155274 RepID=UPI00342AB1F0